MPLERSDKNLQRIKKKNIQHRINTPRRFSEKRNTIHFSHQGLQRHPS